MSYLGQSAQGPGDNVLSYDEGSTFQMLTKPFFTAVSKPIARRKWLNPSRTKLPQKKQKIVVSCLAHCSRNSQEDAICTRVDDKDMSLLGVLSVLLQGVL